MKLKIFVIKKQQLLWAAIILAIIIIAAILLINTKARQTMSFLVPNQNYTADINSDGKADTIIVKADDKTQKYNISIMSSDGEGYTLEPDPTIKSLGYNVKWWPMNISVKDINNDGILEVILQSADGKGPILHVFRYNGTKMERIASGRYSIFGCIKNPSDNGNVLILGSRTGEKVHLTYLSAKANGLTPYASSSSLTLGNDKLVSIIDYIERKDIPASNINVESKYASKLSKGTFLDARLTEAKYSKYDNVPSSCIYQIRTNVLNKGQKSIALYKVKMELVKYDTKNPVYKISSIDKDK